MDKLQQIRALLSERQAEGIIISRRDNYRWLTGNDNSVMRLSDNGVGVLVITPDAVELIADSGDCRRLAEEQNNLGARPIQIPWYVTAEEYLAARVRQGTYLSDGGMAQTLNVQQELVALRMRLSETDLVNYRWLGMDCAELAEKICLEAQPGQTEKQIAVQVCNEAAAHGIHADCVLVGADERIDKYRHPVPTDKAAQERLMVVLGGERKGLNISLTRMVWFTPVPAAVEDRYGQLSWIFAKMQLGMKAGLSYRDYFARIKEWYAQAGYPDEWKLLHQGGPTGYACREFFVGPECAGVMQNQQAYAWNPSIMGTKCEETTVLTEKGVETMTRTKIWPLKTVKTDGGTFTAADILRQR